MQTTAQLHKSNGNIRGMLRVVPYTRMMIRIFFLALMTLGALTIRASDLIQAPVQGASATVSQPHVTAELIPETTTAQPGQPFDVALHSPRRRRLAHLLDQSGRCGARDIDRVDASARLHRWPRSNGRRRRSTTWVG